ncbi:MAG: sigma-54-dependent Fis family transcriptional regulator [Verrucomicrobiae bacterium]|nr:sigma-54-dependent Fis family transcriptional regulator [Verrucomicrobiae bacterium]
MNPSSPNILIADDQEDVLEAFRLLLKPEGYQMTTVTSPGKVIECVKKHAFDLVIMDLNYDRDTTSGREGLELIEALIALDETLPIVVMTAWGTIDIAVEAMRLGARDFVQKPWDNTRILATVKNQIELGRALRQGRQFEEENRTLKQRNPVSIIAESPPMKAVMDIVHRVAPSDANVFISGENGTGKGRVAQLIHALSPRAEAGFISVNTGGLAEGVFESELFGHVRGAFTDAKTDRAGRFELADHGTLFLDEIGNIGLAQQAKLLRVVETGEFERVGSSTTRKTSVRIVSATNANLRDAVADGRFRQDLLYRLNTIEIQLPPLRERGDDILRLAEFYRSHFAQKYRRSLQSFDKKSASALLGYSWPGNVRELAHVVERAVLMAKHSSISIADLGLVNDSCVQQLDAMSLDEVEEYLVKKALERHGGNVSKAAETLGLSRSAFYRRMEKHGL